MNNFNSTLSFMRNNLVIIFCLITLSSFAQQKIKIDDAKNHVGDSVRICSKIYGCKYLENTKGTPTFLNAGDIILMHL